MPAERKVKIMSLEEWADLHGEDYPKGKFFSVLDYGRGDRTCITIYCDYCEQPFEINECEIDDWLVIDPVSGDKVVMCGECESKSKYCTCPQSVPRYDAGDGWKCHWCKKPRRPVESE